MTMDQINAVYQGNFDYLDNIQVSPLSRAYTFSDSIYEVIPFFRGVAIGYNEHLARLQRSAHAIGIDVDQSLVSKEVSQLIESCDYENGYVYYQVSRGVDQIRNHIYNNNIEIEYFGYVKNHGFEDLKFKVLVCDDIRWGRCDIKSTSLLANTMMMNQAHRVGCNEIIMHKFGNITEAGASNIFFIYKDKVCTPKLNNNILPGITRSMSIDIFKKNGINVIEDDFSIDILSQAPKIWLTSSTKGMAEIYDINNVKHCISNENALFKKCKLVFNKSFFNL
jgi:D-alanine transaminase